MEVFVINLRRSRKRREAMSRQLDRLRLPYRIFEATDGSALTEEELAGYCGHQPEDQRMTLGQYGCAISHLRAYRAIAAEGIQTALILEDDLRLSPDLPTLLPALEKQLTDDELILLYFVPGRECQLTTAGEVSLPGGYWLRYPMSTGNVLSATAYLLTQATARTLPEAVLPIRIPADCWGTHGHRGGPARLRCLQPSPISLQSDLPSEIGLGQTRNPLLRPMLDLVNRYNIFPFNKLLAWNRSRVMAGLQEMCTITDAPSPVDPQYATLTAEGS